MKESSENIIFKEKQKIVRLLVEKIAISLEEINIIHCISPKAIIQDFCQLTSNDTDGSLGYISLKFSVFHSV